MQMGSKQGDQIGLIFDSWATVFFGEFVLKITEAAQNFGLLFPHSSGFISILTKMAWATFWATFSPTHPVTLVQSDSC
jgi:hypothetical protein